MCQLDIEGGRVAALFIAQSVQIDAAVDRRACKLLAVLCRARADVSDRVHVTGECSTQLPAIVIAARIPVPDRLYTVKKEQHTLNIDEQLADRRRPAAARCSA